MNEKKKLFFYVKTISYFMIIMWLVGVFSSQWNNNNKESWNPKQHSHTNLHNHTLTCPNVFDIEFTWWPKNTFNIAFAVYVYSFSISKVCSFIANNNIRMYGYVVMVNAQCDIIAQINNTHIVFRQFFLLFFFLLLALARRMDII